MSPVGNGSPWKDGFQRSLNALLGGYYLAEAVQKTPANFTITDTNYQDVTGASITTIALTGDVVFVGFNCLYGIDAVAAKTSNAKITLDGVDIVPTKLGFGMDTNLWRASVALAVISLPTAGSRVYLMRAKEVAAANAMELRDISFWLLRFSKPT